MLKLGIVGTSPISHEWIEAAHESGAYRWTALYSRTKEKAQGFINSAVGVELYTDLPAFLASAIDIVYIASPNSLHYQQARAALLAGKHVIVEKPMVSRPEELLELMALATSQELFLFEAARNYHETAFQTIRDFLSHQTITGATFSYAKYSSKMNELLKGEVPNVFSAEFSGGALMDLGVYAVYAAIALIGNPRTCYYRAHQLHNSVDLNGLGQLVYDDFFVTIQTGKSLTSYLANEIYTTEGTLILDACQEIREARFISHQGETKELAIKPEKYRMLPEVLAFARAISENQLQEAQRWLNDALSVHQCLYSMRQDAAIQFKADLK